MSNINELPSRASFELDNQLFINADGYKYDANFGYEIDLDWGFWVDFIEVIAAKNSITDEKLIAFQDKDESFLKIIEKSFKNEGVDYEDCKKIIENHHGNIHATSKLGKGTAFIIYLPA